MVKNTLQKVILEDKKTIPVPVFKQIIHIMKTCYV